MLVNNFKSEKTKICHNNFQCFYAFFQAFCKFVSYFESIVASIWIDFETKTEYKKCIKLKEFEVFLIDCKISVKLLLLYLHALKYNFVWGGIMQCNKSIHMDKSKTT